jgi:hypothetical protein
MAATRKQNDGDAVNVFGVRGPVPILDSGVRCAPDIAIPSHFRRFPTRQEAPGSIADRSEG